MMRLAFLLCGILISIKVLAVPDVGAGITVATELWEPTFTNNAGQGLYQRILYRAFENNKGGFKYTRYERSKPMVEHQQADLWLASSVDEEDFALYPLHPAFAKTERGQKLADIWDKNIQKMGRHGTLKALFKKRVSNTCLGKLYHFIKQKGQ